jgi:hypothetical protein
MQQEDKVKGALPCLSSWHPYQISLSRKDNLKILLITMKQLGTGAAK